MNNFNCQSTVATKYIGLNVLRRTKADEQWDLPVGATLKTQGSNWGIATTTDGQSTVNPTCKRELRTTRQTSLTRRMAMSARVEGVTPNLHARRHAKPAACAKWDALTRTNKLL